MASSQHLIIDNGQYEIKAGFLTQDTPFKVHNAIARTRDGVMYTGNDYITHTNNYLGMLLKRPFTQGHLTLWETEKGVWDYTLQKLAETHTPGKQFDPAITHLTLTEPPFQLPQLLINTDQIVFEEYGFNEYFRCIPALLVPWNEERNDFYLVVDVGFDATWIVPVIYQSVYWEGVRKLPVGGKLLSGLLSEQISFRHYDVSEETILVNTVKELTCFMAPYNQYLRCLKHKQDYKCEFVLPDFKTTTTGFVRTPETTITPDTQLLTLYDERFSVPETFYHPEIMFDSTTTTAANPLMQHVPLKNLTDLTVEAIMASPTVARPLLAANISIVGGLSKFKGFDERFLAELIKELPLDWLVTLKAWQDTLKEEISWFGGANLTESEVLEKVLISKKEYFEHGLNWCQKQFGFKNLL